MQMQMHESNEHSENADFAIPDSLERNSKSTALSRGQFSLIEERMQILLWKSYPPGAASFDSMLWASARRPPSHTKRRGKSMGWSTGQTQKVVFPSTLQVKLAKVNVANVGVAETRRRWKQPSGEFKAYRRRSFTSLPRSFSSFSVLFDLTRQARNDIMSPLNETRVSV
jgi:hypothetical protein